MNVDQIAKLLGKDSDDLLGFTTPKVKKDQLHIPKSKIEWYSLGLVVRLLFYVQVIAKRNERRLFWDMAGLSMRSSHPHKMMFLVNFYLSFLNTHNIVRESFPEIDTVDSPY